MAVEPVRLEGYPDGNVKARWIHKLPPDNTLVVKGSLLGVIETEEYGEPIEIRAPASGMLSSDLATPDVRNEVLTLQQHQVVGSIDTDASDDTLLQRHLKTNNGKLTLDFIKELVNRDNNYDRIRAIAMLLRESFPEHHDTALKILLRVRDRKDSALTKAAVDVDLGVLYSKMGDADASLKYLQQAVDVFRQQLAVTSGKKQPGPKKRPSVYEKEFMEEESQREMFRLIEAIFILAGVKRTRGDLSGAQEDLQHCLQLQTKFLHSSNTAIGDTHYNLGAIAWELGFANDAIHHYALALCIYEENWPEGHVDVANALHMLAVLSQFQGNWENAQEHAERAITMRKVVLGEHHPDTALAHETLAQVLTEIGGDRTTQALAEFRRAHEIQLEHYGKDHVVPAETLAKAGAVCYKCGMFDEALEHFQLALETYKKTDDVVSTASLYNSIGLVHYHRDELNEANQFHQKAYNLLNKEGKIQQNSSSEQLQATILASIGNIHKRQRKFHEALFEYDRAHELLIKTLGPTHPDVASSWNNRGQLHAIQGNYDVALEQYEMALLIFRDIFGGKDTKHPHIAACYYNIGLVHQAKGDFAKARETLQDARDIWSLTLGETHPQTCAVDEVLSSLAKPQGVN